MSYGDTYYCCLKEDYDQGLDEEWWETNHVFDHENAAEMYAEEIFHDRDMYELEDDWGTEEYSVVVRKFGEDEVKFIQIFIEMVPSFSGVEIKKED